MNILLQGPCAQTLSFLLGEYPEMELLGHGGKCMFQRMCLPNHFTLRTRASGNSTCSTCSPVLGSVGLWNYSRASECKMVSQCA